MGRCHEFGTQIREGCGHPMRPGDKSCNCPHCGVVCGGQFDGCPDVWARGLRPVAITASATAKPAPSADPEWERRALLSPVNGGRNGPVRESAELRPPSRDPVRPPDRDPVPPAAGRRAPTPATARGAPVDDPANARVQLFRWFETEFGVLRQELQTLVGTVTQQQAMVAELADDRQAQRRLTVLAETLPDAVDEAVRAAVSDNVGEIADGTDSAMQHLRESIERTDAWMEEQRRENELFDSSLGELRASMGDLEAAVAEQRDELQQGLVRLSGLKSSLTKQLRPIVDSLPEIVASAVNQAVAEQLKEHREAIEDRIDAATDELRQCLGTGLAVSPVLEAAAASMQKADEEISPVAPHDWQAFTREAMER